MQKRALPAPPRADAADVDELVGLLGGTAPEALARLIAVAGARVDDDWLVLVLAKAFERDVAAGRVGATPGKGGLFLAALMGLTALDAVTLPGGDNLRPLALALEVAARGDAPSVVEVLLRWDFSQLADLGFAHAHAAGILPSSPAAGDRLAPWARGLTRFMLEHDAVQCAERVLRLGSRLEPAARAQALHCIGRGRFSTAVAAAAQLAVGPADDVLHGLRRKWVSECVESGRPEVAIGSDGWVFTLGLTVIAKPELVVRCAADANAEEHARVKWVLGPLIQALLLDKPSNVALPLDANQDASGPCCAALRDVLAVIRQLGPEGEIGILFLTV